jgi:hypothetical protein
MMSSSLLSSAATSSISSLAAFSSTPLSSAIPSASDKNTSHFVATAAASYGRSLAYSAIKSKSAESMRKYREKLKSMPERRQEYKARQIANQKRYMMRKKLKVMSAHLQRMASLPPVTDEDDVQ